MAKKKQPRAAQKVTFRTLLSEPAFRGNLIRFLGSLLLSYATAFWMADGSLKKLLMLLFGISSILFASSIAKDLMRLYD